MSTERTLQTSRQAGATGSGDRKEVRVASLDRVGITLDRVVAALGGASEVQVSPSVRGQLVAMRVADRPARVVREEIADLLNYSWVARPGQKAVLQASAEARAEEVRIRARWFGDALDSLLDYASLSLTPVATYQELRRRLAGKQPEDARLREGIALEALCDPAAHASLRLLLTLDRPGAMQLVADGDLYLRWADMMDDQRSLCLQIATHIATRVDPRLPNLPVWSQAPEWVRRFGIVCSVRLHRHQNLPSSVSVRVGPIEVEGGYGMNYFKVRAMGAPPVAGRPYRRRLGAGQGEIRRDREESTDLNLAPFPASGFRQRSDATWADAFEQLKKATSLALYSDRVPSAPPLPAAPPPDRERETSTSWTPIPLERMTLRGGLDALCARYRRVWWQAGDALFFRSMGWFLDGPRWIAPEMLDQLSDCLKRRGCLGRGEIDRISRFSWGQVTWLSDWVDECSKGQLPGWGQERKMHRLLGFWSQLRADQKEAVLGGGLPLQAMTASQRHAYVEALYAGGCPVPSLVEPPPFRLEQALHRSAPCGSAWLGEIALFSLPGPPDGTGSGSRRRLATLLIPSRAGSFADERRSE